MRGLNRLAEDIDAHNLLLAQLLLSLGHLFNCASLRAPPGGFVTAHWEWERAEGLNAAIFKFDRSFFERRLKVEAHAPAAARVVAHEASERLELVLIDQFLQRARVDRHLKRWHGEPQLVLCRALRLDALGGLE